jgi:hypothetical protein
MRVVNTKSRSLHRPPASSRCSACGAFWRRERGFAELEALSDTELTARIRSDLFEQLGELVAAGDEELIGEL